MIGRKKGKIMLKVYGTMLCKDCVACGARFDEDKVEYEFLPIDKDLDHLKAFLKLRDNNALFNEIKEAGGIGIPCVVTEEGEISLDWEKYVQ